MVYVLISLLSVNKSMYFETYLIPNVVLFQVYVPLYLLFISPHCVNVVSPCPKMSIPILLFQPIENHQAAFSLEMNGNLSAAFFFSIATAVLSAG